MSQRYAVMVVGMGKRGAHHAAAFHAHPRFEVAGICDIDARRLDPEPFGRPRVSTDAAALAAELRPDVFCFCTHPALRRELVQVGIDCGARLIAFEKPLAVNSREAFAIRDMLEAAGTKAVVSHQHRYGSHYQRVKEIIAGGGLGRVHTVYASSPGWMLHMMTHMLDYMRWYIDDADAVWAMAQAAGRGKLSDNHPSPDYVAGVIQFANGMRGWVETGAGAPDQPEVGKWWGKNRIGVQGSEGFAEVLTNGGWRAVTREGLISGEGAMNYDADMPPYVEDMAVWLDDDSRVHPCHFASAFKGFEILSALCRSAAFGGQVTLPLADGMDEIAALSEAMSDRPVLLGFPESAAEFKGR